MQWGEERNENEGSENENEDGEDGKKGVIDIRRSSISDLFG